MSFQSSAPRRCVTLRVATLAVSAVISAAISAVIGGGVAAAAPGRVAQAERPVAAKSVTVRLTPSTEFLNGAAMNSPAENPQCARYRNKTETYEK